MATWHLPSVGVAKRHNSAFVADAVHVSLSVHASACASLRLYILQHPPPQTRTSTLVALHRAHLRPSAPAMSAPRVRRRPRAAFTVPTLPRARHAHARIRPRVQCSSKPRAAPPTSELITLQLPAPLGLSLTQAPATAERAHVVVSSVRLDGPAARHVRVGDVITHVEHAPALSLDAVVRSLAESSHLVHLTLERRLDPSVAPLASEATHLAAPPPPPSVADADNIYAHQDAAIANLIAIYQQARRRGNADQPRLSLLNVASAIVKSRATSGANSPALISAVLYRLTRAAVPLDARFYNLSMWSYIQARQFTRAIALFEDIDDPNVECFTTLAKAYSMLRRPDDAIALIPVMRVRGVDPNIRTYNALIASCVRGGKLAKARQLFSEMLVDGVRPNAVSWNIIINWHVQQKTGAKRLDGALQAFGDMKASGVSPNVITFTTLMKAYAKSGLLNKAEEVFMEMKTSLPGRLDTSVYNTLLTAYASRLDWRRCLELLDEMNCYTGGSSDADGRDERARDERARDEGARDERQAGSSISGTVRRVPASLSFTERRPWLGARDDDSEATPASQRKSVLQRDDNACAPDAVSYSLVVKACAQAGRPDTAHEAFDEMMQSGFFPPHGAAVVSLLSGYTRMGRLSESFGILKNLKSWGVFPDVRMLTTLMQGCLQANEPNLALSVYAKLKSAKLEADVVTYTLLLKAYGLLGELDKAFNVIKGMHGHGQPPNVVTYNTLIACCAQHQRPDLALRALDMLLREAQVTRATFEALVSAELPDEQRLQYLMDVLRRVREAYASPNGVLYHELLRCCHRCEEWFLGAGLVRERENGGFVVGKREQIQVRALEDAVRARALTGNA